MKKSAANSSRSCGSGTSTSSSGSCSWSWSGSAAGASLNGNRRGRRREIGTRFEEAIALADAGKHDEAEKIFAQIAVDGTPAYRALARMRQAAELAQTDPAAAIETYKQISADTSIEQVLRDLAALRAAALLIDAGSYVDARKLLEPLAQPGREFRHAARELLALNAWKSNDRAGAMKWYAAILTDPEAPAASRTRVEMLIALSAADGKS